MKKSGFVLHEALMALGLSMALAVGIAQLLVVVARQRRLLQQDAVATREVGNLMEVAVSYPWHEITSNDLSLELSELCRARLPEAELTVDVADEDDGLKRIALAIQWQSRPEIAPKSVHLVGWKFRPEEQQP